MSVRSRIPWRVLSRVLSRALARLIGRRVLGWRLSLAAIIALGSIALAASLLAAAGLPREAWARLVLVGGAWAAWAALLASMFLPTAPLPWSSRSRTQRSLPPCPSGSARIALTFDDGPHPETTPAILEALARHRVRATFFLVGAHARRCPELVRRIAGAGHAIGNHTERHRLLVFRSAAQVIGEILECQDSLAAILGERPTLFRPPHGFAPVGLGPVLRRAGLRHVSWTGSIRDTDAPGASVIAERALALAGDRRILLLHDNPSTRGQTAAALPALIAGCRARGLVFVALSDPGCG